MYYRYLRLIEMRHLFSVWRDLKVIASRTFPVIDTGTNRIDDDGSVTG